MNSFRVNIENKGFASLGLHCCWILVIFVGGRNNKRAVSLGALSEGRIERFSPRFGPGDHYSDLSFTNLSPGSEREKWQPL